MSGLIANWGSILGGALAIVAAIEGLKNIPFFSNLFYQHPNLAVWLNAGGGLLTGLIACKTDGADMTFVQCVVTAVGTFLGAAAIHGAVVKPVKALLALKK